jgi:hypothetical protein
MLSNLILCIRRHLVAAALPHSPEDQAQSRGVLAGLLAASREVLTPPEFARLTDACEIGPGDLDYLLSLAAADPDDPAVAKYLNPPG